MLPHVTDLRKTSIAHVAYKRLLACMLAEVVLKVAGLLEE